MENYTLINCTQHDITIKKEDGTEVVLSPSGLVPRVNSESVTIGSVNGIPIVQSKLTNVDNIPEPAPNTIYLVSSFVSAALPDREDVLSPDTSPESVIRDESGRIVGVRRLQKI
ncbi:MAG: hypothetical protein PHW28_06600 [Mesotoga sp.]|jgi:hypothetical protein|nr:hypothetical protein [Mesotoga sp.]